MATAEEALNGSAEVTFVSLKSQILVSGQKGSEAVGFYKAAFGAEEVSKGVNTKRKADQELPLLVNAELKLAGTVFLVSDLADDTDKSVGTGFTFCLETDDVAVAVAKAVKAGAVEDGEITESENGCCGGVVGKVKDPYGYVWMICTPAKKTVEVEA